MGANLSPHIAAILSNIIIRDMADTPIVLYGKEAIVPRLIFEVVFEQHLGQSMFTTKLAGADSNTHFIY